MDGDLREKRRSIRFPAPLQVDLLPTGWSERVIQGRSVDVSSQGIRVKFPVEHLGNESQVYLRLHCDTGDRPIPVGGTIRWLRAGKGCVEIGIQFEGVRSVDKAARLRRAIRQIMIERDSAIPYI